MTEQTQEQIDAHNRRELWRDVANHLTVAREAIQQAQSALEDLGVHDYAELLQPHVDALGRAGIDATDEATST